MKKIFIGLIAVAIIIAIGAFSLQRHTGYVATLSGEVTTLGTALASVDAQRTAGTLTPAVAQQAHSTISAQIIKIENMVAIEQSTTTLNAVQQNQLSATLNTLKAQLVKYQSTLSVVDTIVQTNAGTADSPNQPPSLLAQMSGAVQVVEAQARQMIVGYTPDSTYTDALNTINAAIAGTSTTATTPLEQTTIRIGGAPVIQPPVATTSTSSVTTSTTTVHSTTTTNKR